jgi:hypothetical protein
MQYLWLHSEISERCLAYSFAIHKPWTSEALNRYRQTVNLQYLRELDEAQCDH